MIAKTATFPSDGDRKPADQGRNPARPVLDEPRPENHSGSQHHRIPFEGFGSFSLSG